MYKPGRHTKLMGWCKTTLPMNIFVGQSMFLSFNRQISEKISAQKYSCLTTSFAWLFDLSHDFL